MKYLGTILVAYIVLFILDIMQKRNHKTTKSLNKFSIRTKNEILNSTTTFGGGIYSRTVKVYSFI